jgi:hypothetical protein
MQELQANQLVNFYTNSDGKDYLQVLNWTERPRADSSRFPSFDKGCTPMFPDEGSMTTDVVSVTANDVKLTTNVDSPRPRLRSSFIDQTVIHPRAKARGTLTQLKEFAIKLGLPESDGESCFDKWEGNGWKNNGKPIVCWQSTMRSWKSNRYMTSLKVEGGGKVKPDQFSGKSIEELGKEMIANAAKR